VTSPYPEPGREPRSPFPRVRWKFERTESGAQLLLWVPLGCGLDCKASPLRIPMGEEQAWGLTRHVDRVMSWAAPSAEGIFSAGPSPSEAAGQLAVCRYIVTSPDTVAHTRLAQATPWAHWAEQLPSVSGVSWLVDVFGVDDASFLDLAMTFGVTVTPAPASEAASG
jgi:hypothetical protein